MPVRTISDLPDGVVGFVAEGDVTAADYTETIDPAIEAMLADHDAVRLLYVLGDGFTGYSGGALWEDGRLGLAHLTRWERIAVVTDHTWIGHTVNVLGHLLPGALRVFALDDESDARAWIAA